MEMNVITQSQEKISTVENFSSSARFNEAFSCRVIKPILEKEDAIEQVCAYCRVSSDSADQQNSFLAQLEYFTNLIEQKPNWDFVDIYADEGITGSEIRKRNEFLRMIRDCRKGKITLIVTKSIARFARNMVETLQTVRELKTLGIAVHFEQEGINTKKMTDEIMLGFFAQQAEAEIRNLSKNIRRSYRERMSGGTFIPTTQPFGYRIQDGIITIDKEQAKVVRKIFQLYIEGKSLRAIAKTLESKGIKNKSGNSNWTDESISSTIENERYTGDSLWQKSYTTEAFPFKRKRNNGEVAQYHITNTHPAIITKDIFEMANKIKLDKKTQFYRPIGNIDPLSRKIVCGCCSTTFRRKTTREKIYWTCRNHDNDKDNCSIKQIPRTEIHDAFIRLTVKLKTYAGEILFPMQTQLQRLNNEIFKTEISLREINIQIAELKKQIATLHRLNTKEYIASALFMQQINEVNTRMTELRRARQKILNQHEDDALLNTKILITYIENIEELNAEFDEMLFKNIVEKIIVSAQDTLIFKLINGLEFTEKIELTTRKRG